MLGAARCGERFYKSGTLRGDTKVQLQCFRHVTVTQQLLVKSTLSFLLARNSSLLHSACARDQVAFCLKCGGMMCSRVSVTVQQMLTIDTIRFSNAF